MRADTVTSLPADILEELFLACVHWYRTRISPLTLVAVCHQWREVALQAGRLWTDINAIKPEAAEHFVRHSQRAALDVVFCEEMLGRTVSDEELNVVDRMPWLYSQLDRFRVLVVHTKKLHPSNMFPILSIEGSVLPRLVALVLVLADEMGDAWWCSEPKLLRLSVSLPSLRHLTLWCALWSFARTS